MADQPTTDAERNLSAQILQKSRAVAAHGEQAELFRSRYEQYEVDPYSSAFTYGRHKVEAILDRYLPQDGAGCRLLDAGCGSGYKLHTMSARNFTCVGLDAASEMVHLAQQLNPAMEVHHGDVENLPFPSECFDFVLSIEVIRYLADPRIALREFHRVLRPGGMALVTAMPPWTLTGYPLVNMLTSRMQISRFTRVRQFFHGTQTLQRLFRESGFGDVDVEAAFWGPFRNLEAFVPAVVPSMLRLWEPIEHHLASIPWMRDFSNHLVAAAVR